MHPVIIQALLHGVTMLLSIFVVSMTQVGLFWKFLKVRLSFGKYVLVKIRTVHRDYFRVGWVEQNALCYNDKKDKRKYTNHVAINSKDVFYKAGGITWVDLDEETNALVKPDFTGITGFDPVKIDDLITRALYAPKIGDTKEIIMLVLLILVALILGAVVIMMYQQSRDIQLIKSAIPTILNALKPVVVPAAAIP